MIKLDGQVIIITGATGNLGRVVAARCWAAGAGTVLVDHGHQRLGLPETGGHLLLSGVDLTDDEAAVAMVARTVERFGRVDALIHTVGGFRGGRAVQDEEAEALDFLLDINLHSAVQACRAVVPTMIGQHRGRIVTIGAAAALNPPPGLAAYAAAKGAVIRFTEGLARDVRHHGITANCVVPTVIDTPDNRAAMPDADWRNWVPPEVIADVILFLISDLARGVTGATLLVPGTL